MAAGWGGGPGRGCGPAAEFELPETCSQRRRLPRCSRSPAAAGALPNEWPYEPPSPLDPWPPGLAS